MVVYEIEISRAALEELAALRAFDEKRILEAIERQLTFAPTSPTRNRKLLAGAVPRFEAVPPIWELRLGEYRVFYDVSEADLKVYVRAVRRKPPHKTLEEIL